MRMWSDLFLAYAQKNAIHQISIQQLLNTPLCHNTQIKRKLSSEAIGQIIEWMRKNDCGDYTSESKDAVFLYWRSLQEIAQAIHQWADRNAKIGSTEAIMDLTDDSQCAKEIFYKMPVEIVLKACLKLQEVGKAQVFYSDNTDTHGVKFFNI